MKAWLEEYGLIIVGIIVVAALVALAVYTSTKGQKNAAGAFNGFTNKSNTILENNGVTTNSSTLPEDWEANGGSSGSSSSSSTTNTSTTE
jgi:FtsZ-interacting cell division protein ZipA